MQAKTTFRLLALFAVGGIAIPIGHFGSQVIVARAVKPADLTTSQPFSLEGGNNGVDGAGSDLERRGEFTCPHPTCDIIFRTSWARNRHMKTATHPPRPADRDENPPQPVDQDANPPQPVEG
ncbi:hypothetical protein PspLS_00164 [Pyricularia sp. CBS 133598]|nr:hypothetical protein PspLS_00164 [Pyricularia sp. CBS 133598]